MKKKFPSWIKRRMPNPAIVAEMKHLLAELNLNTICESAQCPNIGECFLKKTATFLILGDICTRKCTFCAVKKGGPVPVDKKEPQRLFEAVRKLGLQYVVITSVTRDDLPDGGASQFARTIKILHEQRDDIVVEILIPDFSGSREALEAVVVSGPQVVNHNIETVRRLYPVVRPGAGYSRSLDLLVAVKQINPEIVTKSGLMVGLGETEKEVIEVMTDLRKAKCDLLTIGQYLRPSPKHHPVVAFIPPEQFSEYEQAGIALGFTGIASAPFVRSSFSAAELYAGARKDKFVKHIKKL